MIGTVSSNWQRRVRSGELLGLNITIPHKQTIIPLMDELTPTAQAIGAVNTIYAKDGKLIGHNTDTPGFLSDLHKVCSGSAPGEEGAGHGRGRGGAGGSLRAVDG